MEPLLQVKDQFFAFNFNRAISKLELCLLTLLDSGPELEVADFWNYCFCGVICKISLGMKR